MELAILILAVMATLVTAVFLIRSGQMRRSQALARVAAERGFSFGEVEVPFNDDEMLSILRFTQRRGMARNVMRGTIGGKEIVVFDYRAHDGKRETVVAFRTALPAFDLLTAVHGVNPNVMAPVFARLGMTVMRFNSHSEFGRNYLLIGPDEEALRRFFQPSLLDYFQSLDKTRRWAVESSGTWLLVGRSGYLVKPEELPAYLEEAGAVAAQLSAASADSAVSR